MTATLDAEVQALLSDALGRLASRHAFQGRRGGPLPRPVDRDAWTDMAEIGLVGLAYPVDAGGFAGGASAQGSVCRAIGRALLMVPFLSTGVVAPALVAPALVGGAAGDAAAALDLGAVIAGTRILALAHAEPRLGYASGPLATAATTGRDDTVTLSGRKVFVIDAGLADAFLVSARDASSDGISLYLVARDAGGLRIDARHGVDERPTGEVTLDAVPALLLASTAAGLLAEALDRAALAVCAEALGAMERVVEATGTYLQSRRAFGQTLSRFQVLRHRFVDMHIAVEEVSAILSAAEEAWDVAAPDRGALLAACKVTTCRKSRFVAENGVQLHGGIGVTDDIDISHYFKRLMMLEACFGDDEHHLARHATSLFRRDASARDAVGRAR